MSVYLAQEGQVIETGHVPQPTLQMKGDAIFPGVSIVRLVREPDGDALWDEGLPWNKLYVFEITGTLYSYNTVHVIHHC